MALLATQVECTALQGLADHSIYSTAVVPVVWLADHQRDFWGPEMVRAGSSSATKMARLWGVPDPSIVNWVIRGSL
jgi:hypothetical protein